MYSTKTLGIALSFIHLMLGVLSIVFGMVAIKIKEARYNDGVFGMGIWLGIWMLITCLSGLLAAHQPMNIRRISCYIGFCCVGMVIMLVCCIPLIVGPILHFSFESKVSRQYYKQYGPDKNYYLPQSHFDERNRIGRIGCGIYGTLLCIIVVDIFVTAASCFIWKCAVNINGPRRHTRHCTPGSLNGGCDLQSPTFISPQIIEDVLQNGFVINTHHLHPKLPSYTDIYPEGSGYAWDTPQPNQSPSIPIEPPPAYSDTTTTTTNNSNA